MAALYAISSGSRHVLEVRISLEKDGTTVGGSSVAGK